VGWERAIQTVRGVTAVVAIIDEKRVRGEGQPDRKGDPLRRILTSARVGFSKSRGCRKDYIRRGKTVKSSSSSLLGFRKGKGKRGDVDSGSSRLEREKNPKKRRTGFAINVKISSKGSQPKF